MDVTIHTEHGIGLTKIDVMARDHGTSWVDVKFADGSSMAIFTETAWQAERLASAFRGIMAAPAPEPDLEDKDPF